MWSRSKKSRFDLTLNGRNVVRERVPNLTMHTAPGRGYNSRQLKYIDIRDLLQGSYAPSWRLEKSRDVTQGATLDPLPAPRDVDRINEFLSKSADPRMQRNCNRNLSVSGSGVGVRLASGSAVGSTSGRDLMSPVSGEHETLEEEYRALRDLTRTEPRYVEPSGDNAEYINFVEPKPLHRHGQTGDYEETFYVNVDDEDDDSYYGEDDSFAERVNQDPADNEASTVPKAAAPTQGNEQPSSENPGGAASVGGGGTDVLVVGDDFAPSLSPIAESAGPLRGWTFHEGGQGEGVTAVPGGPEGEDKQAALEVLERNKVGEEHMSVGDMEGGDDAH